MRYKIKNYWITLESDLHDFWLEGKSIDSEETITEISFSTASWCSDTWNPVLRCWVCNNLATTQLQTNRFRF